MRSRQRLKQAQGPLVGLVPDPEARVFRRHSYRSRVQSIRLRTVLLGEVRYEDGLSLEQS